MRKTRLSGGGGGAGGFGRASLDSMTYSSEGSPTNAIVHAHHIQAVRLDGGGGVKAVAENVRGSMLAWLNDDTISSDEEPGEEAGTLNMNGAGEHKYSAAAQHLAASPPPPTAHETDRRPSEAAVTDEARGHPSGSLGRGFGLAQIQQSGAAADIEEKIWQEKESRRTPQLTSFLSTAARADIDHDGFSGALWEDEPPQVIAESDNAVVDDNLASPVQRVDGAIEHQPGPVNGRRTTTGSFPPAPRSDENSLGSRGASVGTAAAPASTAGEDSLTQFKATAGEYPALGQVPSFPTSPRPDAISTAPPTGVSSSDSLNKHGDGGKQTYGESEMQRWLSLDSEDEGQEDRPDVSVSHRVGDTTEAGMSRVGDGIPSTENAGR